MLKRKILYIMKITEDKEIDPLRKCFSPESIEKAPDGFTDKIMTAIHVESVPFARRREKIRGMIVPVCVVLFLASLVLVALLTGNNEESMIGTGIVKFLANLKLPDIKTGILSELTFPGVLIYIAIGIFVLVLLDILLRKYFTERLSK